jgi:hypothetical protein
MCDKPQTVDRNAMCHYNNASDKSRYMPSFLLAANNFAAKERIWRETCTYLFLSRNTLLRWSGASHRILILKSFTAQSPRFFQSQKDARHEQNYF